MTDDTVPMLPLPEPAKNWLSRIKNLDDNGSAEAVTRWFNDYARACVAHATAARDAEIEALRAEVAKQSAYAKRTHDWNTELLANNERLAEALRSILEYIEEGGYGFEYTCERVARAALNFAAAQESDDEQND